MLQSAVQLTLHHVTQTLTSCYMHKTVTTKLYATCLNCIICFKLARLIAKYYEKCMGQGTDPQLP